MKLGFHYDLILTWKPQEWEHRELQKNPQDCITCRILDRRNGKKLSLALESRKWDEVVGLRNMLIVEMCVFRPIHYNLRKIHLFRKVFITVWAWICIMWVLNKNIPRNIYGDAVIDNIVEIFMQLSHMTARLSEAKA